MKVRNGFVTNSSSSSYIIAYKDIKDIDVNLSERYPWIETLVSKFMEYVVEYSYCDTEEGEALQNKNDVDQYFVTTYGWLYRKEDVCDCSDDELNSIILENKNLYDELMSLIGDKYNVVVKEIGYHDKNIKDILKLLREHGMIKFCPVP